MSRCPKLEAILAAKYEFESASPDEQARRRAFLDDLLRQAVEEAGRSGLSARQLEASLREVYPDFVRARKLEERQRLSRLR